MKKSILIISVLLTCLTATINSTENTFKAGDWFECEMEFENELPVFRNHWIPTENEYPDQTVFISLKFTYAGIDSLKQDVWNYEILRFKTIRTTVDLDNTYYKNLYVFDSWYPDYFNDAIAEQRKKLKGKITVEKDDILVKQNDSKNTQWFDDEPVFTFTKPISKYSRSSSKYDIWSTSLTVKKAARLIFQINKADHKATWIATNMQVSNIKRVNNQKLDFAQFENRRNKPRNIKKYSAYLLNNGLAYAFEDNYNQKVMAITNANFNIPSTAAIEIFDERSKEYKDSLLFPEWFSIYPENLSYMIYDNEKPRIYQLSKNKTSLYYKIKCGVVLKLTLADGKSLPFFINPGEKRTIRITDSNLFINGERIIDSVYKGLRYSQTEIGKLDIDQHFKAYLNFINRAEQLYNVFQNADDLDSIQNSVLPYFYLKSYHYSGGKHMPFFAHTMNYYYKAGKYYRGHVTGNESIRDEIQNLNISVNNFLLYFHLKFNFNSNYVKYKNHKTEYEKFENKCGDNYLKQNLWDNNWKRYLKEGKTIPFKSLKDHSGQEQKILPKSKPINLLYFYGNEKDTTLINQMKKSLPMVEVIPISNSLFLKNNISEINQQQGDIVLHPQNYLDYWYYLPKGPFLLLVDRRKKIIFSEYYPKTSHQNNLDNAKKWVDEISTSIYKVREVSRKEQQRLTILIFLWVTGTILLIGLVLIIVIRSYRKNQKHKQLIQELKLKSVQSQLNPHFLFNALNSIQLLVGSNKNKEADTYLVSFSELLRGVLKNADQKLVPLSEELDLVKRYCELEKLRMDFDYNVDIKTILSTELIEVPYMLLQPIVENALKHGISKLNDKGCLQIEIVQTNGAVQIKVIDNGPGIASTNLNELKNAGKGLQLTLEKLHSIYGNDAVLEISNNAVNKGTMVKITLKIG